MWCFLLGFTLALMFVAVWKFIRERSDSKAVSLNLDVKDPELKE